MQNLIYCKINIFDLKQTVYKITPNSNEMIASVEMEHLGHTIATACENNNCFNVRLNGNIEYVKEIADDIRVTYALMYNKNQEINIEVAVE